MKDTAEQPELPRDAYALLAQANLLRMRGCWQEAVDRCMDAMRLAPGHASVHSLLGDIYDNRGSMDDAIQWYRMALDVNPDSPADQVKLARLLDAKSRQSLPSSSSAPPRAVLPVPTPLRAADPERLLRHAAYGAGGTVLAIIALALVLSHSPVTGAGGEHQISAPPIVLPSVETSSPSMSLSSAASVAPMPRDPAEQDLVDALRADGQIAGSDTQVVDVQSDPRAARLTLTVAVTPAASAAVNRSLLLGDALRAAQAAARIPSAQTVTAYTVRCLVNGGSSAASLALVADATKQSVVAVTGTPLAPEQVQGAFSNVWWSPSAPAN